MATKHKIFIDGEAGTTGLEIAARLSGRDDLELVHIDGAKRKDLGARLACARSAAVTVLCLPDEASAELAQALGGEAVRLIDASTKHRTADGWVYGIPELKPDFRKQIAGALRVSNPGCWATGFALAVRPLVQAGLVSPAAPLTVNGVSGYSGGGKSMIAEFESLTAPTPGGAGGRGWDHLNHYANYRLDLAHKHLPEMMKWAGLKAEPLFLPAVDHFYRGMLVQVPLHRSLLDGWNVDGKKIEACLKEAYAGETFVSVKTPSKENLRDGAMLDPRGANGTNRADIYVLTGAQGHVNLSVVLDNLGKGASGAAVQNLNLMLGLPEDRGLV